MKTFLQHPLRGIWPLAFGLALSLMVQSLLSVPTQMLWSGYQDHEPPSATPTHPLCRLLVGLALSSPLTFFLLASTATAAASVASVGVP